MRAFIIMILVFYSCLKGQEVKLKQVKPEDYSLWGNLNIKDISKNGKWVSFQMQYENGDTVFVQNIGKSQKMAFPSMAFSNFYFSKWYAGMKGNLLELADLEQNKRYEIPDVQTFDFTYEGKHLVYLSGGTLYVKNLIEDHIFYSLRHVQEFRLNKAKDKLVFIQELKGHYSLGTLEFGKDKKVLKSILFNSAEKVKGILWADSGKAFTAYYEDRHKKNGILFKNWEQEEIYQFKPEQFPDFPVNHSLYPEGQYRLTISDDLEKVFFSIKENIEHEMGKDSNVEIWDAQKSMTYIQKDVWEDALSVRLGVWYPKENRFFKVTSPGLPFTFLSGDQKNAIVFNPFEYEPQNQMTGATDYYFKNLKTGELQLFLKKGIGNPKVMLPSPDGQFIAYFHDKNWWVYEIEKQRHRNLSKGLNLELESSISDGSGELSNFGFGGWIGKSESIIIYDRFDLWEINIRNSKSSRLTYGREKEITYRVEEEQRNNLLIPYFDGFKSNPLDLKNGILLRASGADAQSGYFILKEKGVLEELVYEPAQIDEIQKTENGYVYREQRFDLPPKIVFQKGKEAKDVFQSNPHHKNYEWGKAEAITYKIPGGKTLNGILYYPAGFDPNKKYPMVVSIYDQQFSEFHWFIAPTQTHDLGFNISNYTSEGYFVLLPDIVYEEGKTGQSAVNCVVAAVEKVKGLKYIAHNKIGLFGHSFGGYETNFIVTQTNIFAAAVSGAGVSNLVSFNFTLNWVVGKPDNWRMETQQWRIRKSFYEDKELYKTNSPIEYADQIQTPLLTWSGKKDFQINWHQSIEWYLALRNLHKKNILLLYPDEGHVLLNPNNQKDLNQKTKEWFDYYLKGKKQMEWMGE